MTPLYNHEALHDFTSEVLNGVDEVVIHTYFIGLSPRLSALYSALRSTPHTIYVGHTKHTTDEAHSLALDVLLVHPFLNIYLLPDSHVKLWVFRRKKTWHSYVGSYNLCPNHTAQLMVRLRGTVHSPISTTLRKKLTVNGNPSFAGLPFTTRTTYKDRE